MSLVLMSVVMLAVSGGIQLVARIRAEQQAVSATQHAVAALAARTVSSFVLERFSVLETATWISDPSALDSSRQRSLLQGLIGLRPSFRQLVLTGLGQPVRVLRMPHLGADADLLPYGDAALAGLRDGPRYVSPVYVDPVTSEPQVTMAVPVVDALGDRRGALLAQLNLKFMWDLVDRLGVGDAGHAYVVDKQGRLIACGDPARVLKGEYVTRFPPVGEFTRRTDAASPASVSLYTGLTGAWVVGTHVALDTPDWAVVVEVPWAEAYHALIGDVISAGIVFLVMTVLSALVGLWLAAHLSVPITNLMQTAERIADGDRTLLANVGGPLEVAGLATAFNSMTLQLRSSLDGLEQRVAERTTQLEAANRELEAFAYSVSHDLRAPLRAVDGYSRILMEDYHGSLDAEGQRVCSVVREEAQRMGRLIDDLLAFSRIGRAPLGSGRLEMAAMVRSVFGELTTPAMRDRIDLRIEALPAAAADAALVHQVWTNLLSNAIKFSSKRERAFIVVEGWRAERDAVFAVRDNGAGFDPQYAAKLFGVFQRLHTSSEFEGTGVGLAIAQRIVQRHGGRIWADGETGKGASFYFTLPGDEGAAGTGASS